MKLRLSYPVAPKINQLFGNSDAKYTNMALGGHNGIDFYATNGTPVYATHDGFASYQVDDSGGHGVVIITDKEYEDLDGNLSYWKSISWHLCDPLKQPQFKSPIADKTGFVKVENGDLIGYADNTGFSTGSHLHYGLKPVKKGENNWVWYNTEQENGYKGAVNPMPYFDKSYAGDIQILKKKITLLQKVVELLKQLRG